MSEQSIFKAKSTVKVNDLEHKRKIAFNIQKYNDAVAKGKQQFAEPEIARKIAKNIKWEAIEHLDQYLLRFEQQFTRNGGKVIWAENKEEALDAILEICKAKHTTQIVKSKSMVTEELYLNAFLEAHNIASVETDLGEYIQQLDGEPPYHIVTPAMHKSKEDVARLFHEKLHTAPDLSPPELTMIAREQLRAQYTRAEVGITGANFIVADTGSICITENEGNGRLTTSFPKTQITVAGIEKIIPSVKDLGLLWPLLASYGTGQVITSYNTILSGPKSAGEQDGPEEMYVILLDNGRSKLLEQTHLRESLYCIRCGSCLNACPVYKNIGGHTYHTTYSGPIGSVISPHLNGFSEFKHLSYASSLCGNCTEVCPVRINIHEMLLENRHIAAGEGINPGTEKLMWKLWNMGMHHKTLFKLASGNMKTMVFSKLFSRTWNLNRKPLQFPKKSFTELWKETRP